VPRPLTSLAKDSRSAGVAYRCETCNSRLRTAILGARPTRTLTLTLILAQLLALHIFFYPSTNDAGARNAAAVQPALIVLALSHPLFELTEYLRVYMARHQGETRIE
jgi:hypothetical protein